MSSAPARWDIITGEYPPQPGGVSDYTRQVARELAARGQRVFVWAPEHADASPRDDGVEVARLAGHFGPAALAALGRALERAEPGRLLVQYVPHAFGWRAMNLPLCAWLASRRRRERVVVMFHEVAFPRWTGPPRHRFLAEVQRVMARLVVRAADEVHVSTPIWEPVLRDLGARGPILWSPIMSSVPTSVQGSDRERARRPLGAADLVIGHFGTFGGNIAQVVARSFPLLLGAHPERAALFTGRGSDAFATHLVERHPELRGRIVGTGGLPAPEIAAALSACDLLVQPYADGASTRRASLMSAVGLGRPVVSNAGKATEPEWTASSALALAPSFDPEAIAAKAEDVLRDEGERARLARSAADLYARRFSIERHIAALLGEGR